MKPVLRIPGRALALTVVAAIAGCDTAAVDRSGDAVSAQSYRLIDRLPPAVVVAERPTVSDILDLVLRERPTAAQLAGNRSGKGFPEGSDEAHVAAVLAKYTSDRERVDRIAAALVKEGRRKKIGSSLLMGVLLTENPWLDPRAKSFVGARGLMQVMPFHAGKWGCPSNDLFDIEANICHGVAVLAENLGRSKTLPQALLGYNGCVRGTNTPDCWRYPNKVFKQARKTTPSTDDVVPFSPSLANRRAGRASGSS